MPASPPRRRITLADMMLLVASTAALFVLILRDPIAHFLDPIQALVAWAAAFLCFGGFGVCAARWRGRPWFEGFFWGFICGPFGALMIALMRSPPDEDPPDRDAAFRAPWH